jgi:predicted esterase
MRVLVTHGTQDTVVAIGKGKATAQHFAAGDHEVQWLQFDGPHTVAPAVKEAIPRFLRGGTVGTVVTAEP